MHTIPSPPVVDSGLPQVCDDADSGFILSGWAGGENVIECLEIVLLLVVSCYRIPRVDHNHTWFEPLNFLADFSFEIRVRESKPFVRRGCYAQPFV